MLERFLEYMREENLCQPHDRLLLAVSGGMDSMYLATLFSRSPFSFGIAHCNFGLRNEESDEDEQFVRQRAVEFGVPFYSVRFPTIAYAREQKISTQMAARRLRYDWFDTISKGEGYQAVVVAHHLNDLVETMLINLIRGTGPAGMHGILPKAGKIIRPLLCFTREEIAAAVLMDNIPYREESSNASDKYLRNRLRHQVVPVLKASNPSLERTFASTARHFLETEQFIEQHMRPYRDLLETQGENLRLACSAIRSLDHPGMILYQLLRPFGFNAGTTGDILKACNSQPGRQFLSATHKIIKDREHLVIIPLENAAQKPSPDEDFPEQDLSAGKQRTPEQSLFERLFDASVLPIGQAAITSDTETAFLDYEKLRLPLTVRYWQEGDRFQPLGMKGKKKLSDFFVDLKIPLHLKHHIPLVISGGEIVWVAGCRIADPFKVTVTTKKVYRMKSKFPKKN